MIMMATKDLQLSSSSNVHLAKVSQDRRCERSAAWSSVVGVDSSSSERFVNPAHAQVSHGFPQDRLRPSHLDHTRPLLHRPSCTSRGIERREPATGARAMCFRATSLISNVSLHGAQIPCNSSADLSCSSFSRPNEERVNSAFVIAVERLNLQQLARRLCL